MRLNSPSARNACPSSSCRRSTTCSGFLAPSCRARCHRLSEWNEDIYNGRERRYYDALLHGELAVGRESNLSAFVDEVASRRAELSGASSSAAYASRRITVSQDKDKLLNGISEMRYFDGEKHIVFLAEQGIRFETREEDQIVARAASDARIVLNTIVTGGIPAVGVSSSTIYEGRQTAGGPSSTSSPAR